VVPTHYGLTTRGFDPEENRIISFSYLAGDRPDDQIANPGAHPDYIDVVVERRSFVEWRDREYPRLGERPPPLSKDGVRWLIERELLDHPDLRTVNDLETTLRAKGHRFKRSILRDLYREVTGNTTPGPKGRDIPGRARHDSLYAGPGVRLSVVFGSPYRCIFAVVRRRHIGERPRIRTLETASGPCTIAHFDGRRSV
jgi:hypothetical protein